MKRDGPIYPSVRLISRDYPRALAPLRRCLSLLPSEREPYALKTLPYSNVVLTNAAVIVRSRVGSKRNSRKEQPTNTAGERR